MTPEQRAFLDAFLVLAEAPAPSAELSKPQREFLSQFLALAGDTLTKEDAVTAFERLIIGNWAQLTWRVQGALAARFAELDDEGHRVLRALEDTPSLLAPLRYSHDEISHSRLLAWALRLGGDLGDTLRGAWLRRFERPELPRSGWVVRNERTLGENCRLDVEIEVPGEWLCFVEMKVDALERKNQLPDYRRHLDSACAARDLDGTLVFLTVDGDKSVDEVMHDRLSFRELLRMWLPLALRPEPNSLYLRAWLTSIAHDLCEVGARGPMERWSFSRRAAALDFLEELESPDE